MERDPLIDAVIIDNSLRNADEAAEEARKRGDEEDARKIETTTKIAITLWAIVSVISIIATIVMLCVFLK